MKIRVSNVTNSSSASFFLTVETVYSNMEEFKNGWEKFILESLSNEYSEKNAEYLIREIQNIGIKHLGQNMFRLGADTSMLNDLVTDLPKSFLRILLDVSREVALPKYGIKTAKLEVFEDNGSYDIYPMEMGEEQEKELRKEWKTLIKKIKKDDIEAKKRWDKMIEENKKNCVDVRENLIDVIEALGEDENDSNEDKKKED